MRLHFKSFGSTADLLCLGQGLAQVRRLKLKSGASMYVMVLEATSWGYFALDASDELQLDFEGRAPHFQQVPSPRISLVFETLRGVGLLELFRDHHRSHVHYEHQGPHCTSVSMSSPDGCNLEWGRICEACEQCLIKRWQTAKALGICEGVEMLGFQAGVALSGFEAGYTSGAKHEARALVHPPL